MVRCNVCLEHIPTTAPAPAVVNTNDDNASADNNSGGVPSDDGMKIGCWTCPKNPHHTACFTCVSLYTQARLSDGVINVPCPGDFINCAYMLTTQELRPILPPDTYQRLKHSIALATDPKARECPFCENICRGHARNPKITCDSCKKDFCFFHGNDHEGTPCTEPVPTRIQVLKTKFWRWRNSRKCPQCHNSIQKDGGCQHVTCRCGYEMCWNCGGPWAKNGRRGHLRTLFPSPKNLKYCCNTWRIWSARVGIITALIVVVPVCSPFVFVGWIFVKFWELLQRKRTQFKQWRQKRKALRALKKKKSENEPCVHAHYFPKNSITCYFCGSRNPSLQPSASI